jgi:hypothetical protein
MAIQLTPETEALLVRAAERESRDPNELADVLISTWLRWDDEESPEELEAIRKSLEAAEAGRERPFEEFLREHRDRYPDPAE